MLYDVKTIGIIGAGKIGTAIIKAIRSCYPNVRILASARRNETLENAKSLGAITFRDADNDLIIRKSDVVVLSVKPYHFPVVVKQVSKSSWKNKIVISVMAGIKLNTLQKILEGAYVYRSMPNINALVGHSTTAVALVNYNDNGRSKSVVNNLLKCLGSVYWVPEDYLDVWTGLIGSGPAFIAEIIDGLVLGAVAAGMNRDVAYKAILDTLEGTVKLLTKRNEHPAKIRDEVTTPAGTTIRGIMILESEGVKAALMKVVEETTRRSFEIGNEIDNKIKKELKIT